MIVALLGLIVAQQPLVTASFDQETAAVGEQLQLTLVVESIGSAVPRVAPLELVGLELVDERDRRQVRFVEDIARRTLTRVFTLRATRTGEGRVRPIGITHNGVTSTTAALSIVVTPAGPPTTISTRVRRLLDAVVPQEADSNRVAVTLIVQPDSVLVGTQTDIVLAAWFPREVRTRIRSQPTLDPPQVRGAWVYQRPTPAGVALTRWVGGREYDIYVVHLAAFPLTAGGMEVGRGTVSYSLPLSFSFLSREVRMEVSTAPRVIPVSQLPTAGQPESFAGALGEGLQLDLAVSSRELPLGGAARVELRVHGVGNVSLWPDPSVSWPPGVRAYPQDVVVQLDPHGDRIGGSKSFHFLVVADTTGAHRVPAVRYDYFDMTDQTYRALHTQPIEFVTQGMGGAPLLARERLLTEPVNALERWVLPREAALGIAALLPLLALMTRRLTRRRVVLNQRSPGRTARVGGELRVLMEEVRREIRRRVPHEATLGAPDLGMALRAAGVELLLALHIARVRDRLQQSVFGPAGASDATELRREVEEVLRALQDGEPHGALTHRPVLVTALMVLVGVPVLAAQSAEALYEAGAVSMAADSFALRAAQAPRVARHWYNLALSYEAMGEDGRAAAALLNAGRLAPRHPSVRRRVIRQGTVGRNVLTWISPATPDELLGLGLAAWLASWILIAASRRRRWAVFGLVIAVILTGGSEYVRRRYAIPLAFVTADGARLREAPYGPAQGPALLGAGDAVRVERRDGAFLLVRRGDRRGWLRDREVVRF